MPSRINVGRLPTPRILAPRRVPVDTYVAPPRDSDEEQIASSLAELVPSLARFSGRLGEEKAAKDKEAGEAAARDMAAKGHALTQEVKDGKRHPADSVWFRVGFYETAGRNAGSKYVGDFLEALEKSPVSQSFELADFDKLEKTFRSQWVKSQLGDEPEPFLANAFGSTADGQIAGIRNQFAQQAGNRMVKANFENFHSEIFGMVQSSVPIADLTAQIRLAQERQVVTGGMTYDQVNRATASAVGAAAVRLRDTTVLDILDQIPTNAQSKGKLGGTSYGSEIREKAEIAVARAIDDDTRKEIALQKRTRDKAIRTITDGMVDVIQKNPTADLTTFIDEAQKYDPGYVPTLFSIRDAMIGGVYADEPDVVRTLAIGIDTKGPGDDGYTTQKDLDNAFASKQLTFQTWRTLVQDLDKRNEAGGSGKFLRNPILTDIEAETKASFFAEWPDSLVTPAVRINAQAAADEAVMQMLRWLKANPEADAETIHTQKTAIREAQVRVRLKLQEQPEKSPGTTQSSAAAKIKPAEFLLAEPILVGQLQREFDEIGKQTRNGYSPALLAILRKNQVDPTDYEAVREFLKIQTQWTTSTTPKP